MPIKYLIIGLVALLAVLTGVYVTIPSPQSQNAIQFELGGDFTLTNQRGEVVTQNALKNRPHIIFFGFTHCPDVCPTSLNDITQAFDKMGASSKKLDAYFITVDPERDTVALLNSYLSSFDKNIVALTGTRVEIDRVIKSYRIFAKKQGEGESYTYDHSASFFMFDKNKQFVGTIAYNEKLEVVIEKLQLLIKR
jgi:protein SCO1/2